MSLRVATRHAVHSPANAARTALADTLKNQKVSTPTTNHRQSRTDEPREALENLACTRRFGGQLRYGLHAELLARLEREPFLLLLAFLVLDRLFKPRHTSGELALQGIELSDNRPDLPATVPQSHPIQIAGNQNSRPVL